MKNLKKIMALALALMLVFALCACGGSDNGGSGDAAASGETLGTFAQQKKDITSETVKIWYIPMSTAMENTPVITKAMEDAVAAYENVEITTFDAQFDPNTQITLINDAITQGVDGIIVQCADATALNSVIEEAEDAGIVVFTMNIGNTASPTLFMCNSDYNAGYQAAEYLDNKLGGEGNLIILDVPAAIKETCRMGTGFEDYCDEHGCFTLLENVGFDTTIENGYTYMRDLLTKYDDIDLVYCTNDNQAIGAYQAIKEAGREGDGIILFGYEGQPAALDAIKQGNIYGTSYSDPYYESFVQTCMMLYCIQTGINSNVLGYEYTPFIELGTTIVTADNIDEIIASTHWDLSQYGY